MPKRICRARLNQTKEEEDYAKDIKTTSRNASRAKLVKNSIEWEQWKQGIEEVQDPPMAIIQAQVIIIMIDEGSGQVVLNH